MPSKIQLDENLVFLYRCLMNSDCKTIDFNAVGAAANLKAPAARMRYSRLKNNIETKLGGNIKTGPARSTKLPGMDKVKATARPSKRRKVSYENEHENHDRAKSDEDIDNVWIKDGELQDWTARPRTRGKKIDLQDVFDSDSAPTHRLRNQGYGSSDDYEAEDDSENEEGVPDEEDSEQVANQPLSTRRKTSTQSANWKVTRAQPAITSFKTSSKAASPSFPNKRARKSVSKATMPVPLDPGPSSQTATKEKSIALPPTSQSIPIGTEKQESGILTLVGLAGHRSSLQRSPVGPSRTTTRSRRQSSLFQRIESARVQAAYNLRRVRSSSHNPTLSNEIILPSIEHDDQDDDGAMSMTSSNSKSQYSEATACTESNPYTLERQSSTGRLKRERSSTAISPLSRQTGATIAPADTVQPLSNPAAGGTMGELCVVQ